MATAPPTARMRALAAPRPSAALVPLEIEAPTPGPNDVVVRVACCALCHSDVHLLDGEWPTTFPLVPGHEIVGHVGSIGAAVPAEALSVGARVGIGWQSGACFACRACVSGHEHLCQRAKERTCVGRPGGLAELVRVDWRFAHPVPSALTDVEAAPLLCAGATVFSALTRIGAGTPGRERLGVIGLGGLGHLAVQFGRAMGCDVVAFDPAPAKEADARRLGARALRTTPGDADLAGAFDLLLACTPAPLEWDAWAATLDLHGTLCLVGVPRDRVSIDPSHLLDGQKTITGSVIASPAATRACLTFAAQHGVRPWVETMPMRDADRAFERLRQGGARYRLVLEADAMATAARTPSTAASPGPGK